MEAIEVMRIGRKRSMRPCCGQADSIVAIDHTTGRLAWRRTVDSVAAVPLAGELIAVERSGALDVIDARTGGTAGTAPLAGRGLHAVSRGPGDLLVKTRGDLIAIDRRTGAVRWRQPASWLSPNPAIAAPRIPNSSRSGRATTSCADSAIAPARTRFNRQ